MATMKFAKVKASEVKVAPRGRKVETDADLVAAFKDLAVEDALNLEPKFGVVASEDRPKIGQTIRKNWKAVRSDDCRIDFGTDGIPFVRVKVAPVAKTATKTAAKA